MTPEQILQQLADNQSTEFPEAAIREVMANPAPYMEALLAEMAKPAAQLREEGYRFLNLAGYLTAYHRETRAYPLLIRLLRADYEDVDFLFNDALIDDVSRMLASVCGDELAPLIELIKDQTLDEYVRNSGLQALRILYHVGRLSGEDFHALITELVQNDHVAGLETLTTMAIVEERLSSLTPVVEEWFRDERIEPFFFESFDVFTDMLNQPSESSTVLELVDDPIAMARNSLNLDGLTNDSAKAPATAKATVPPETGTTTRASSKPAVTLAHDAIADGAYVRTQAKVGRNDPCPCGSGKKFKKCCGK